MMEQIILNSLNVAHGKTAGELAAEWGQSEKGAAALLKRLEKAGVVESWNRNRVSQFKRVGIPNVWKLTDAAKAQIK